VHDLLSPFMMSFIIVRLSRRLDPGEKNTSVL
jgi:hypothetical protein